MVGNHHFHPFLDGWKWGSRIIPLFLCMFFFFRIVRNYEHEPPKVIQAAVLSVFFSSLSVGHRSRLQPTFQFGVTFSLTHFLAPKRARFRWIFFRSFVFFRLPLPKQNYFNRRKVRKGSTFQPSNLPAFIFRDFFSLTRYRYPPWN